MVLDTLHRPGELTGIGDVGLNDQEVGPQLLEAANPADAAATSPVGSTAADGSSHAGDGRAIRGGPTAKPGPVLRGEHLGNQGPDLPQPTEDQIDAMPAQTLAARVGEVRPQPLEILGPAVRPRSRRPRPAVPAHPLEPIQELVKAPPAGGGAGRST